MKKIFFNLHLWLLAVVLLAVGCNHDDEPSAAELLYQKIYPGVVIYNTTSIQQSVGMDGADVALKLAMLLDECEGDFARFHTEKVSVGGREHLLMSILFGARNTITYDEATGDYLVTYTGDQAGITDQFLRMGSYRIKTGNLRLWECDAATAWQVVNEGTVSLSYSDGFMVQTIDLTQSALSIYRNEQRNYVIQGEQIQASFRGSEEFSSDWALQMHFTPLLALDDLSFTTHAEDTFLLWGEAEGPSIYGFDGVHTTDFSYRVGAVNPLKYKPSRTSRMAQIIEGIEQCALTDASQYSQQEFPASQVTIERSSDKDVLEISTVVSYNGLTMKL